MAPDYADEVVAAPEGRTYAAGHGWTPHTGPFAVDACRVMLARYRCQSPKDQHDPALPPEDVDAFGYKRTKPDAEAGDE